MKKHAIHTIILLAGTLLSSCIEPYEPKDTEAYADILVIDGSIDASSNRASVAVTHAMALTSTQSPEPESGAQITVEDQAGNTYALTESKPGQYETATLSIDVGKQYRLVVKTGNGKIYQSAYVQIQQTPPIDSISWKPNIDGITIYANTHGNSALNSSGYYQWNFIETWEYTSRYYWSLKIEDGQVVSVPANQSLFYCWKTVPSTTITVGSSKKLTADVIREFPLTLVPKGSYQLSRKYSIIVQQRSLTEEGYNYWLQLQKTTQNVGGLFDPLPARVTGNFTCVTNPDEPVLGFFTGSTVNEQRIFVNAWDLPSDLHLGAPHPYCSVDSIPVGLISNYADLYLIGSYGKMLLEGYLSTSRSCVDCTVQGGVTTKPDFWQ